MNNTNSFSVRSASWEQDSQALMKIRTEVFVQEQNVPVELESDSYDNDSWYVMAESSTGDPIACARLQRNGKVTRIAVLKDWRRRGIARALLQQTLKIADEHNLSTLYLHAQLSAASLYEEFGFTRTGAQFEEAGIQHIKMTRPNTTH